MVGVCVTDGDNVETGDATLPEIRRDDVFADVEVGLSIAEMTAGVEQHGFAVRSDDEEGVSLTDVDGGDLEVAGARLASEESGAAEDSLARKTKLPRMAMTKSESA
jgi:hypothetical protein